VSNAPTGFNGFQPETTSARSRRADFDLSRRVSGLRSDVDFLINNPVVGPEGPQGPDGPTGPPGTSGGGAIMDVWVWISAATSPAGGNTIGATRVAVDNDAPSASTNLLIHKESKNANIDYGGTISTLSAGDHVYLQAKSNANSFHRYTVTGPPTLNGSTTYVVPVSTDSGSAAGTEPQNGADVLVSFQIQFGPIRRTINTQAGTTYTPVLTDENRYISMTNAGASTLTLPSNATRAFAIGAEIEVVWWGTGQPTIVAGSGATVSSTVGSAPKLRVRYSWAILKKMAANDWLVVGDIA
jgi:hypothetical protein